MSQPSAVESVPGVSGAPAGAIPHARKYTDVVPPLPLAAYAPYFDGPAPTAAEVTAQMDYETGVQDAIATCMTKRGFRYVPLTFDAKNLFLSGRGDSLSTLPVPFLDPDRTVVERNGYGMEGTPAQEAVASAPFDDPNAAYVQSLSPAEAAAYDLALNGDYTVPTTTGSCGQEAQDANPEPTGYSDRLSAWDAEHGDVIRSAIALLQSFGTDPRVVAVNREWGACMAGKGYVFDRPSADEGPMVAMFQAERTRPDGSVAPVPTVGTLGSQIPADEQSLLGTQAERVVALADYDCRASTDYMSRLTAIMVQMQNDFIAANGDALLRLKNSQ